MPQSPEPVPRPALLPVASEPVPRPALLPAASEPPPRPALLPVAPPPFWQAAPDDPDRTVRPAASSAPVPTPAGFPPQAPSTSPATTPTGAAPPSTPLATTPYFSSAELRAIPTYKDLLTRLAARHSAACSAAPPQQDLEGELKTLLQYDFPSRSPDRPREFFAALPDEAQDAAGELIAARMAQLQDRIAATTRKRRTLAAEHAARIHAPAREREDKLLVLLRRGEMLRGGVGRLLVENGFLR